MNTRDFPHTGIEYTDADDCRFKPCAEHHQIKTLAAHIYGANVDTDNGFDGFAEEDTTGVIEIDGLECAAVYLPGSSPEIVYLINF